MNLFKNHFIAVVCVLTLAVLTTSSCTTVNPVSGKKQFVLMTEQEERRLGEELYPQYTQNFYGEFQDENLQKYVTDVGLRIAAGSQRPNLDYEFNVVNSSIPNAYALPGGKISITRGLIGKFENEAQLAAVFGHEVGHVAALHAVQGYTRQVVTNLLLTGVGYYMEKKQVKDRQYYMLGGQLVAGLTLLKYGRDQERTADQLGMKYLADAGYDPYQFVTVMQVLKSLEKREPHRFEALFRSHPLSAERIVTAETRYRNEFNGRDGKLAPEPFERAVRRIVVTAPAYELFDKGEEKLAAKDVDSALRLLKDAVDKAPDQAIIRGMYGRALYESGRIAAATSELDIAVEMYPDQFHIRLFRGIVNVENAHYRVAISDLARADELIPNQPPVAFFTARAYDAQNRRSEAAAFYIKFLESVPEGEWAEEARSKLKAWGYTTGEGT